MIKQIAWNTFKNTGNIDTFLEFQQIVDLERNIRAEKYEDFENERNSNIRKQYERL